MRKTTTYHYSEGDVRQFIKDELQDTNKKIDTLSGKFDEFRDKIYTLLDKAMSELKIIREEQTVLTGNKDQIEDHETRIEKVEQVLNLQQ